MEKKPQVEQSSHPPSSQEQERAVEFPTETVPQEGESARASEQPSVQPATTRPLVEQRHEELKDPLTRDVEMILEDGLGEMFLALDEATRQEFKVQGEVTASAITKLLRSAKVQARKIVELITNWLRMIPGVSRFFLEQEAKIKTDRLLEMKRQRDTNHD